MRKKEKNKNINLGFTLIELLVVISIIALLSSAALIAFQDSRQKARDVKRLSDITQMSSVLELYYNINKGYPSGTTGQPAGLTPSYTSILPTSPLPADGVCEGLPITPCGSSPLPACGTPANAYYYLPTGTQLSNGNFTDYNYYFCLGNQTGNYPAGLHVLTPRGVR